jgi:hypothetical protein
LLKTEKSDLDAQIDFIDRLNNEQFTGQSDWRRPEVKELLSIIHRNNDNPAARAAYFPNTMPAMYRSSTTHAYNANYAWVWTFSAAGHSQATIAAIRQLAFIYVLCVGRNMLGHCI